MFCSRLEVCDASDGLSMHFATATGKSVAEVAEKEHDNIVMIIDLNLYTCLHVCLYKATCECVLQILEVNANIPKLCVSRASWALLCPALASPIPNRFLLVDLWPTDQWSENTKIGQ